nr:hypothetical protein [Tanacetum cinerariifolium]
FYIYLLVSVVMSADFAVTYSSVHSKAPHSLEYVPKDHVPVFVLEFEHPEDLVPAEDEAHASLLPPGFLSPQLVNLRVSYQVDVCTRESSEFCTRHHDAQKDRAAVRAEIEVLRSERLAYGQEGIQTREGLARSEAYCRALEARVAVLETHARRLEWQRQAADDLAVQHIMRTRALEAGARDDTLEDTGSSS